MGEEFSTRTERVGQHYGTDSLLQKKKSGALAVGADGYLVNCITINMAFIMANFTTWSEIIPGFTGINFI